MNKIDMALVPAIVETMKSRLQKINDICVACTNSQDITIQQLNANIADIKINSDFVLDLVKESL